MRWQSGGFTLDVMGTRVALLLVAMLAAACSSAPGPELTTTSIGGAPPSSTAVALQPEPLPSGRDAIAAAEGSAHVLWFWGAH